MKKTTSLIEKLAEYQLDVDSTKNIKGGLVGSNNNSMHTNLIGGSGGGDAPPPWF